MTSARTGTAAEQAAADVTMNVKPLPRDDGRLEWACRGDPAPTIDSTAAVEQRWCPAPSVDPRESTAECGTPLAASSKSLCWRNACLSVVTGTDRRSRKSAFPRDSSALRDCPEWQRLYTLTPRAVGENSAVFTTVRRLSFWQRGPFRTDSQRFCRLWRRWLALTFGMDDRISRSTSCEYARKLRVPQVVTLKQFASFETGRGNL